MSFGYSRPHSTDSWRSRRPSFELSSRMHSVPRNIKSTSRHTAGNYCSEFSFVESPLYYMHRNDTSMSRESLSPRSSVRSFDREDFSAKYPHKNYDKELQRKMTFNLHEEIEKPFLTIILEEICDPDRINDICLNTLTSMMRSKTHRKFLHHMNNSAIPNSQRSDITNNNKIPPPNVGKENVNAGTSQEKANQQQQYSTMKKVKIVAPAGNEKPKVHDLPKQFEEYRTQTLINRKRRQDEINALEKLKGRLPPVKKSSRTANKSNESEEDDDEREKISNSKSSRFNVIINSISAIKQASTEENVIEMPQVKGKPALTAEEYLKTNWLRLTDTQIADLEAEMLAAGKDPGIHHFSKVKIDSVFGK